MPASEPPSGAVLAAAAQSGLAGARPAPLLERDHDLAALRAVVDAMRGGEGGAVVVEGPAGIGKTRLLAEASRLATGTGLRVLSARGGELEREFAFGIVRQLFEPLLARASAEEHSELLAGAAGLAAPLFTESALVEPPGAGDVSFAMLHGLYWLAANIALAQPTLLVVDDLHWGDAQSLRWLVHSAHRLDGLPLALAIATRPPEQSEQAALLTELVTDPAAAVLRPAPLGHESVATLARDMFAVEPAPQFSEACLAATGGNPLYLRALLLTLAGEGLAPSAGSAAHVREVGPEPVARAVSLRLSRVHAEAEALARAIAVLGQGADLALAADIAGLERSDANAAAAALARTELLRLEPTLEFSHPVVRAAVYETIGSIERLEAHRRAAGLLAEAGAEPEKTASHLLLVPPADDPFATTVLREAARRALARGAPEAAVTYLRRALAEPPAAEERGDLLWELGVAELGLDLAASLAHLDEALSMVDDPAAHAEIALDYGRAEMYANIDRPRTIEIFHDAIDRLGDAHPELRELLEAELINGALGGGPDVYAVARDRLACLDDHTLTGGFGTDLLLAGAVHFEVRRGFDRRRTVELAERSLASGRLERTIGHALYYSPHALGAAGEVAAANAAYDRAIDHVRRGGNLLTLAGLLGFRGSLSTEQGDLLSAEQDLREGLELARQSGLPGNVMYLASWLAEFLLERGALEEADSTLTALGLPEHVPESMHLIFFLIARGRLRLDQRAPAKALDDFLAIGRIAESVEIHNPAFRPWRSHAAIALHALQRDDDARKYATEELELARRWGAPRPIGITLRVLGLIERGHGGEQRLREAVDVLAPSPARLEHAKALLELGSALRRRSVRTEARELLRQAAELANRCGAIPIIERANEELAAAGARPRRHLVSGLDSLTASERRVAQLAAEELTNKEIAQRLFVTVKTVEVHLSNVYRKLDIASRRQLAEALARPSAEAVTAGA